MEYMYNARVSNHKYIQHGGEARGLYVLVVTHECIYSIQPCMGCINWFVAYTALIDHPDTPQGNIMILP